MHYCNRVNASSYVAKWLSALCYNASCNIVNALSIMVKHSSHHPFFVNEVVYLRMFHFALLYMSSRPTFMYVQFPGLVLCHH